MLEGGLTLIPERYRRYIGAIGGSEPAAGGGLVYSPLDEGSGDVTD
jgi:hypothetical protein